MTIRSCYYPFNSQDLSNSPLQLLIIPLLISYENLVTDQDNLSLILSILITRLLDSVWILKGDVTF